MTPIHLDAQFVADYSRLQEEQRRLLDQFEQRVSEELAKRLLDRAPVPQESPPQADAQLQQLRDNLRHEQELRARLAAELEDARHAAKAATARPAERAPDQPQLAAVAAQLRDADQQRQQAEERARQISAALGQLQLENGKLVAEREHLSEERQRLSEELNEMTQRLARETASPPAAPTGRPDRLQLELRKEKQRADGLQAQLERMQQAIQQLEKEVVRLRRKAEPGAW